MAAIGRVLDKYMRLRPQSLRSTQGCSPREAYSANLGLREGGAGTVGEGPGTVGEGPGTVEEGPGTVEEGPEP